VHCTGSKRESAFLGVAENDEKKFFHCTNCEQKLEPSVVENNVNRFVRELVLRYYAYRQRCKEGTCIADANDATAGSVSQFFLNDLCPSCYQGRLAPLYKERDLHYDLKRLKNMFDDERSVRLYILFIKNNSYKIELHSYLSRIKYLQIQKNLK
jgi:hypothetical protein